MPAESLDEMLIRVQEVAYEHIAPHANDVDERARWPAEGIRALQAAGLGGIVIPPTMGGLGFGLTGLLRACETIAQHCASTAMCYGMHGVASAVLAAKASPEQVDRFIKPIVEGRHLTTLALSEPGTGAHFYVPQARVMNTANGYVVNGTKSFVTNGGHADSYVISGQMGDEDAPPGEFSCLVLPNGSPGMTWKESWRGTGMRGNSSVTLRLDDVPLPQHALLGAEGDQTWYVFNVVAPYFLAAMAGTYLGVGQAALDEARAHLKARSYGHSGEPLARAAILQHRLGDLWAGLERARRLAYYAAEQGDLNGPDAMPALLSGKAEASDAAVRMANECMTLMGGIGYAEGSRLDRHLRDARAGPVMSPTNDLLRTWTGRWLLGEPILAV